MNSRWTSSHGALAAPILEQLMLAVHVQLADDPLEVVADGVRAAAAATAA